MAQDLTDAQWAFIELLLPELPRRADGRGRPWRDSREVLNGILWILRTGAQWSEMPGRYPPYQTCHRRFQQWRHAGVMDRLLRALAQDLESGAGSSLTSASSTAASARPKRGRRSRQIQAGQGLQGHGNCRPQWSSCRPMRRQRFATRDPLRSGPDPRCPHRRPAGQAGRGKAYDSDPLDRECEALGVTLIAPHKRNRVKPSTQDGRPLRCYKRRWKVERLFAWLQNHRRLITRFEYYAENFLAFLQLAAFMILAKRYL